MADRQIAKSVSWMPQSGVGDFEGLEQERGSPVAVKRRRGGLLNSSLESDDQLQNSFEVNKAQEFLRLCRKASYFKRSHDGEEHEHAWDEVREELESLKNDDFLATFVTRLQDEQGYTALHYVCTGKPPLHVVESLVGISGSPLRRQDKAGNLPLHNATKYGASFEVVRSILQAYPEAINMKNAAGRLPLLNAVISNAQPKVVQLLRDKSNPLQVRDCDDFATTSRGFLALCYHRRSYGEAETDWEDVVTTLLSLKNSTENPNSAEWVAEQVDDDEDTPLHIVCSLHAPLDVVQLLVGASRMPLQMQNEWGGLPLHYALLRKAPDEVIQFLCKEYPAATRVKDEFESLPLHYALRNGASAPVVDTLVEEFPEACALKDRNGHLPLHLAAIAGASDRILSTVVEKYPKATRSRDNMGSLPVHLAGRRHSFSRRVMKILEETDSVEDETTRRAKDFLLLCDVHGMLNPQLARRTTSVVSVEWEKKKSRVAWDALRKEIEALKRDACLAEEVSSYRGSRGNTPVHVACMNCAPVDVVRSLMNMPRTPVFHLKNSDGWLPLHCCIRFGASIDVVKVLLDACPESSQVEDEEGKLPFEMAVEHKASAEVKKLLFDANKDKNKEIEDVSRRAREFRRLCTTARHESKQNGSDYDAHEAWKAVCNAVVELKEEAGVAKRVAEVVDDDGGMTPLHIVCSSPDPPVDVVELVMSMSKEPLRTRDKRDRLPIHIALIKGASNEVLTMLLKAHPTKEEFLGDEGLNYLRIALSSGVSVKVIKLLTEASPVPCSKQGVTFLESLELHDVRERMYIGHDESITNTSLRYRDDESVTHDTKAVKIPEVKMKILIDSFLDNYQEHEFGTLADRPTDDDSGRLVGTYVSFKEQDKSSSKEKTQYALVDRFFNILRKMPANLTEESLSHPSVHDMLNKMISRRSFTFILMADFFVQVMIIWTFHRATIPGLNATNYQLQVNDTQFGFLIVGIVYLILREALQMLSYRADRVFELWYTDLWNWLDVSYIVLLLSSTIEMRKAYESNEDYHSHDVRALVMVTGGLTWIMLLVELKSTLLEFSVFISGFINIVLKLIPFLITSVIILEAFAFMYFILESDSHDEYDCPPMEMVGLESGGHVAVEAHTPSFCTFRDAQLKVFTMVVSIEASDFADGGRGKAWLSVVFAFIFIVILLNVLIAIVNENWEDVQRDGKAVFWQARYSFVNEVDALGAWAGSWRRWMKDFRNGKNRGPGPFRWRWFRLWIGLRGCFRVLASFIGYCFWLLAGLVTLGFLWDDSIRARLLCREPTITEHRLTNENLQDNMESRDNEIVARIDGVQQEVDTLKKQLVMLLQEQRAQNDGMKESIETLKGEVGQIFGLLRQQNRSREREALFGGGMEKRSDGSSDQEVSDGSS